MKRTLALAAGAAAGLLVGWLLWHQPAPPQEAPAPARELPGGGLVLERSPDPHLVPADTHQAAREAGGVLERAVAVTVRPRVSQAAAQAGVGEAGHTAGSNAGDAGSNPAAGNRPPPAPPACECEDVTVDLGLVRMPDQTRRVVATARGGEIVGGIDIPLEALPTDRPRRWAAGVSVAQLTDGRRQYGGWVDRDLGRLRLGVEVGQRDGGAALVLRAGVRF